MSLVESIEFELDILGGRNLREVQIRKEWSPEVAGAECPESFGQIWYALLKNAIQATTKGGSIAVAAGRQDGNLVVSVEDSGSGIPADEAPLIFEAFHSTREAGDGRGLALAVSKATLEACSGSLAFTSIPGKTIFTATFPASAARNGCPDPGPDW